MIKAGIVGGAGYTAGELVRLLVNHSKVEIDFVFSTSNAGNRISNVHQDLAGEFSHRFTNDINPNVDIVFLCLGHGNSTRFLKNNSFSETTKIIDLSNDFRLTANRTFQKSDYVYGLPELNKESIAQTNYIANPGCFATAIQLALLPLAKAKLLTSPIHINAVTGATGAGTSLSGTTHFTWRDNNFSHYKAFNHQHLAEIEQNLKILQKDFDDQLYFIPNRGNFSRGIFATIYTTFEDTVDNAYSIYHNFYKNALFTFVEEQPLHLKQVVNTNKCLIQLSKYKDKLLITSVIDNLLKGASGQAIHNMNIMFGFNETEGLKLKANYF